MTIKTQRRLSSLNKDLKRELPGLTAFPATLSARIFSMAALTQQRLLNLVQPPTVNNALNAATSVTYANEGEDVTIFQPLPQINPNAQPTTKKLVADRAHHQYLIEIGKLKKHLQACQTILRVLYDDKIMADPEMSSLFKFFAQQQKPLQCEVLDKSFCLDLFTQCKQAIELAIQTYNEMDKEKNLAHDVFATRPLQIVAKEVRKLNIFSEIKDKKLSKNKWEEYTNSYCPTKRRSSPPKAKLGLFSKTQINFPDMDLRYQKLRMIYRNKA